MSTGNDSILDAYLYETNTLLEQLDSIVLASEEKDTFSEEDKILLLSLQEIQQ